MDEVNAEDEKEVWGESDRCADPIQQVHDFMRLTSLDNLDTNLSFPNKGKIRIGKADLAQVSSFGDPRMSHLSVKKGGIGLGNRFDSGRFPQGSPNKPTSPSGCM